MGSHLIMVMAMMMTIMMMTATEVMVRMYAMVTQSHGAYFQKLMDCGHIPHFNKVCSITVGTTITFITIRAIYVINCKKQMELHLSSFRLSPGILGVNMMILTALLLRNRFNLCLNAVSRLWSAVGGVLIARVTPDWKTGSLMTTYYHNVVSIMSIRGRRLCELAFCMKLLVSNKMVATYIILMLVGSS